jgi:hypothetical protein
MLRDRSFLLHILVYKLIQATAVIESVDTGQRYTFVETKQRKSHLKYNEYVPAPMYCQSAISLKYVLILPCTIDGPGKRI